VEPANRVNASGWEGGEKCSRQCCFEGKILIDAVARHWKTSNIHAQNGRREKEIKFNK
jgi:hypothetical protein